MNGKLVKNYTGSFNNLISALGCNICVFPQLR